MSTLNPIFERAHLDEANIDADGAFNDGFSLPIENGRHRLVISAVLAWCAIAWFIGTYVMVAACVRHVGFVWMKIAPVSP